MRWFGIFVTLGVGAAFGWLLACYGQPAVRAGQTAAYTQWEYRCVQSPRGSGDHPHASSTVLNNLGKQGWEMVTVDPTNGHFCFKRLL